MTEIPIDKPDAVISKITALLDVSQSTLEEILNNSANDNETSVEDKIYNLQLVLQYRLSSQDVLALVMRMYQNLLAQLGIQQGQSANMNLDRLAYALGSDDLKHMLNILSILVDSLLKVTSRYHKDQATYQSKSRQLSKQNRISKCMHKLREQQEQVLKELKNLECTLEALKQTPGKELDIDYIASLTGPILHFYEQILHQLGLASELYEFCSLEASVETHLHELIHKTNDVLHLIPSIYKPHPHYALGHFDHKVTSEDLEQRASAKRLRPFM